MTNGLYKDVDDGKVYVLLKTKLGWIAVDISDGCTFGGLKKTKGEAIDGLEFTGFVVDVARSTK